MKHWVKGGHNYYYNLRSRGGTWVEPEDFVQNNTQLNKEDIQVGPAPPRRRELTARHPRLEPLL